MCYSLSDTQRLSGSNILYLEAFGIQYSNIPEASVRDPISNIPIFLALKAGW